jgi:predicted TIM-barrel fold metal-dependent hydrolase
MIFDSHMHVGDFPLFNVSLDRDGLAALMRETGISQALLFSPDNELVRAITEDVPGVWALYWANPNRPEAIAEAHAFLEHPRFRGIKFHPLLDSYHPNDPSVHPFMQLAGDRGLPVLFHTGHPIFTLPWSIEEVAANFPDTKVVFGHMGHGNVVYINASIEVGKRNPNVYLETSGMPMHTKIRDAIDALGPTRVLYGSDMPAYHPQIEIDKVRLSGLSDELVDRVLDKNARALFLREAV